MAISVGRLDEGHCGRQEGKATYSQFGRLTWRAADVPISSQTFLLAIRHRDNYAKMILP